MARVARFLLVPGPSPCPCSLAPVRPLLPASLPVSPTVLVPFWAPHVPLPFLCAVDLCCGLGLCPSRAPATLRHCLRPGPSIVPALHAAAPCAFDRTWYLPPSSVACHLSTFALRALPCASALCTSPCTIVASSAAPSVISMPPGPLVFCLDHATLQLRQHDVHRSASGRPGANRPWRPFEGGGLRRVRLHVGVA